MVYSIQRSSHSLLSEEKSQIWQGQGVPVSEQRWRKLLLFAYNLVLNLSTDPMSQTMIFWFNIRWIDNNSDAQMNVQVPPERGFGARCLMFLWIAISSIRPITALPLSKCDNSRRMTSYYCWRPYDQGNYHSPKNSNHHPRQDYRASHNILPTLPSWHLRATSSRHQLVIISVARTAIHTIVPSAFGSLRFCGSDECPSFALGASGIWWHISI